EHLPVLRASPSAARRRRRRLHAQLRSTRDMTAGAVLLALGLTISGCRGSSAPSRGATDQSATLAAVRADAAAARGAIEFLERRVREDPLDILALNQLAAPYLQRIRETGDVTYLPLASRAAELPLTARPADRNVRA